MNPRSTAVLAGVSADSTRTGPALSLRQVEAGHRDRVVVRIDSMDVFGGEVLALLGRSGVGKTTALSAIAGTLPHTSGIIAIDGEPAPASGRVRLVARTIQSFPLLHWLSVRGNLALAAKIRGVDLVDAREILRLFRADHLIDRMPKELSGGERCRASLAQAAVGAPRALLLDEPFGGLDTWVKRGVADSLFEFARRHRSAVLFVTHDLHDAFEYADRAAVLAGQDPATVAGEVMVSVPGAMDRIRSLLAPELAPT